MKLTTRLIIAIVLITTTCLLLFGLFQYKSAKDRLYSATSERLDADVVFLKNSIVQPMYDFYHKGVENCLLAAMNNETIISIIVLSSERDGSAPLYGYHRNKDGLIEPAIVESHAEHELSRKTKLLYMEEIIGEIKITASMGQVTQQLQRLLIEELLRMFVLNILIASFLIIAVRSKIVQPILSLTEVAHDLAEGNLTREIPKGSVKEVADLGKSMDILRKSILSKIKTLEEKNTELLRNEKNLSTTLNSIGDAVIATDRLGNIVRMNPIAEQLTGWSFTEARGQSLSDVFIIKNLDSGRIRQNPVDNILLAQSVIGLTNRSLLISKNLKEYHIADSGAPIRDETGVVNGVVLVFRDISNEHQLEKQLRQSQKLESMGTLAAGIAHDFNNILAVIVGQTELIELFDTDKDSPVRPRLKKILKASYRAKNLIDQILAISRQREVSNVPVDLVPMAKEVAKFIRSSAPSTIDIIQNITEKQTVVLSNPSRIHQIFLNLCTNAVQAMGAENGALEISIESVFFDKISIQQYPDLSEGNYAMIVIADTGPGISKEVQRKIFDPYFTTKNEGEGTGLGLAVVHGIVKSQKGHITVYSEQGRGTTFRVLLPQIENDIISVKEEADYSIEHGTESILLVDDDEQLLHTGSDILENLGYKVTIHSSPDAALKAFSCEPSYFDLVITDFTMPGLSGFDLYKELSKIHPDIPVILCSGFGKGVTDESAKREGFRALLNKPFETFSLAKTIRSILDEN